MELQNIRIFVMCAKHLSFSHVAELTYTSQSSVSKCISALESDFSGELFVRSSRKMELTALGEALLPYAEGLLAKEDELRGFLHQYHTGQHLKPLVVGIAKMLGPSPYDVILFPLTNAIEHFQQMHPDVDIKIRYFDESALKELIAGKQIDLALTVINSGHVPERIYPGADFLRLNEIDNYILYSPRIGEFTAVEELLPRLDCMISVGDQIAMSVTYDFLRKLKFPLRVDPCDNWSEAIVRVKNGQGATILGNTAIQVAMPCGLQYFSLKELGITTSMFAIWNRDANANVVDFATTLRSWFADASSVQTESEDESKDLKTE